VSSNGQLTKTSLALSVLGNTRPQAIENDFAHGNANSFGRNATLLLWWLLDLDGSKFSPVDNPTVLV